MSRLTWPGNVERWGSQEIRGVRDMLSRGGTSCAALGRPVTPEPWVFGVGDHTADQLYTRVASRSNGCSDVRCPLIVRLAVVVDFVRCVKSRRELFTEVAAVGILAAYVQQTTSVQHSKVSCHGQLENWKILNTYLFYFHHERVMVVFKSNARSG
jgi:hypothetical protein